jgi:hypothetical protein
VIKTVNRTQYITTFDKENKMNTSPANDSQKNGFTVSQALRRTKKLKGRMGELTARATTSVSYLAEKKPAFGFKATRDEMAKVREDLIALETAIAKANATTSIDFDGKPMTLPEAIRRLQEFKSEMVWLSSLTLRNGTERHRDTEYDQESGRTKLVTIETTYMSDMDEVERAKELDRLRDHFERLNDLVETANHKTLTDWKESATG